MTPKKGFNLYYFPLSLKAAEELLTMIKFEDNRLNTINILYKFAVKYSKHWRNLEKLLKLFKNQELIISEVDVDRIIFQGDFGILDKASQLGLIKREIINLNTVIDDDDELYEDEYNDEYYADDYDVDDLYVEEFDDENSYHHRQYNNTINRIDKVYDIPNTPIRVKLEGRETNIYILNKEREIFVRQCKYLLLNIPEDDNVSRNIPSMDVAANYLDSSMENDYNIRNQLTPQEEFWGHCSNLEAWAREDYDSRMLHSSMAMPLLKELVKVGDQHAMKVFSLEIIKMFKYGIQNTTVSLIENNYLDYLNEDDINQLLKSPTVTDTLIKILQDDNQTIMLSGLKFFKKCGVTALSFLNEHITYIVSNKNDVLEIIEHFAKFLQGDQLKEFFEQHKELFFEVVLNEAIVELKEKIILRIDSRNVLRLKQKALLKRLEIIRKRSSIERIKKFQLNARLDRLNLLEDIING